MKKLIYFALICVILASYGCQPAGQQLDTSAQGADPGKAAKKVDAESGNDANGPTKAVTD